MGKCSMKKVKKSGSCSQADHGERQLLLLHLRLLSEVNYTAHAPMFFIQSEEEATAHALSLPYFVKTIGDTTLQLYTCT